MSQHETLDKRDLAVRHYIYHFFVSEMRPPMPVEAARAFGLPPAKMEAIFQRLHDQHLILLDAGTHNIRMANPFSGVPTTFQAAIGQRVYDANCAWDMLGIPALGQASTGFRWPQGEVWRLTGEYADTGESAEMTIAEGQVLYDGPAVIHFPLPVRQWYDDLVAT